jgi:hypothetical protein
VAEWSIAPVLKTGNVATRSRVRIPPLPLESQANQGFPPNPHHEAEGTGVHQNGTGGNGSDANRMQTFPAVGDSAGVPSALSRAWPHLPDHVKLAILSLAEPYRHLGTGTA